MSDVLDRILQQRQKAAGLLGNTKPESSPPRDRGSEVATGGEPSAHSSLAVLQRAAAAELDTQLNGDLDTDLANLPDLTEDLGSFGWLRGTKERAVMLELRKKTGAILAVGYAWIEFIEFEPSEGITLWIPGRKIHIQGRNLNAPATPTGPTSPDRSHVRLFEGLTRHRVPWVREEGNADVNDRSASVLVEKIVG